MGNHEGRVTLKKGKKHLGCTGEQEGRKKRNGEGRTARTRGVFFCKHGRIKKWGVKSIFREG